MEWGNLGISLPDKGLQATNDCQEGEKQPLPWMRSLFGYSNKVVCPEIPYTQDMLNTTNMISVNHIVSVILPPFMVLDAFLIPKLLN